MATEEPDSNDSAKQRQDPAGVAGLALLIATSAIAGAQTVGRAIEGVDSAVPAVVPRKAG
jgi:hypothetical protein